MKTKHHVIIKLTLLAFAVLYSHAIANWTKQTTGLPATFMGSAIDAVDERNAVLATSGEIFSTTDGGENWYNLTLPADAGYIVDISMADEDHIWFCNGNGKIFFTANGGGSWTNQFSNETITGFMNYIEMFDTLNGIAMGDAASSSDPAAFLKTNDGGLTWTSVNDSAIGPYSADTWRRLCFVNSNVGYFFPMGGSGPELYKTSDCCSNWQKTNYEGHIQCVSFYDENIGLTISGPNAVKRTLDGGESWESLSSPHSGWGNDFEFAPQNPALVWMTDNYNLYFSDDTGKTWIKQLADCDGRDIVFVNDFWGWLLGDDGVYRTTSGGLTSVDHQDSKPVVDFELFQNYPNPFNASTVIAFNLITQGEVRLNVFNLKGEDVGKILNTELSAGHHEAVWNAGELPSGTYFYRLEIGGQFLTRKLVLLK